MEVRKVPGNYVKSFSSVLISLLETSIVSLRNLRKLIIEFTVFVMRFLNIFKLNLFSSINTTNISTVLSSFLGDKH